MGDLAATLPVQKGIRAVKEMSTFSPSRLRQLRRRHILLWLLFFLVIGLVLALTLFSWQRSLRPAQVALVFLNRSLIEKGY